MRQATIKFGLKVYARLIHLILVLFLISCNTKDKTVKSENVHEESSISSEVVMNNPVLFLGSSFGEFFQMLHKTGEYKQMLTYTSKETRNKFIDNDLLIFYRNMSFSFPLKLTAFKDNVLYYQTTINATVQTIQIPIIVENDTCRVVFNKLDINRPFTGM